MGGIHHREMELGGPTCLLGFSGREWVGSALFDASTLTPGGVDEVQTVTLTGSPTGGTFTLSYKGQETTALAYNATAQAVEDALKALGRIGWNGVDVTGSAGGPYTVTFQGPLAKQDVELLVGADAMTGGTNPAVAVAETTKGSSRNAGLYVLEGGLILSKTADGKKVKPYTAATNINEVQTVTITGTPTGGTFTLEFRGEQTTAIAYNATAATVQTALEALPNIDSGDVAVTGGPGPGTPYVVTFTGDLGGESVPLMRATGAFTGGTTPAINVAQTTQGSEVEQIVGIFDGRREFIDNTAASNKEIPVYGPNAVFDRDKVKDYSTHEGALLRWAQTVGATFKSQAI